MIMNKNKAKPTFRQEQLFSKILHAMINNEKFTIRDLMIKSGYTKQTAKNPEKNVLGSDGFRSLLGMVDDTAILARLYQIVLGHNDKQAIEASKELLKLKDRYPDSKHKVTVYDEREELT